MIEFRVQYLKTCVKIISNYKICGNIKWKLKIIKIGEYMKFLDRFWKFCLIVVCILFITGCQFFRFSNTKSIHIKLDDDLAEKSIELNIVGVSEKEENSLNDKTYFTYWDEAKDLPENYLDSRNIKLNFNPYKNTLDKEIKSNDPVWDIWKDLNCKYIFIASNSSPLEPKWKNWKVSVLLSEIDQLYIVINEEGIKINKK